MGCSKSNSKREVCNNTILPQETRKTLNRQPNSTSKTAGKRRTEKTEKLGRKASLAKLKDVLKVNKLNRPLILKRCR